MVQYSRWTIEDDNQLIYLLTGEAPVEECAWILDCSSEEIRQRAFELIQDGKLKLSEATSDDIVGDFAKLRDVANFFSGLPKTRGRRIWIHPTPIDRPPSFFQTRNDWTKFRNYWIDRPNLEGFWLAARKIAAKMEEES